MLEPNQFNVNDAWLIFQLNDGPINTERDDAMLPKLTEAKYLEQYRVWLKFSDGVEGQVDLEAELWGEVFEPLKDVARFAELKLDPGFVTVVWPNGADFAPEFLYQKLRPNYALKPTPKSGAA